jgi:hypothetical protein
MALVLTPTPIVKAGTANLAYATPNSTENIPASGQLILHVKNTSGGAITVTPMDPGLTVGGTAALTANNAVTVGATTGDKMILLPASFINPTTQQIQVVFSATASVTGLLLSV